ncbi:hypothetical protein HOLleu_35959 [Holothuria leucospilota]|uniref:Uncharacterized protein n=1 Tax=Holothuria leucospilota TaxID=206669 RepID=A0A9Q0YJ47_HOLLE|nr:hypothetical protein HOLleu_35959 [Holothuria leucospilota]
MSGKETRKSAKETAKKSPQVSKKSNEKPAFTPPTLRHRAFSDVNGQDQILRDLKESMDLAFTEVNKKIDSMLLNQQSILRRISTLEDTQKGLEESYNFLSSAVDDLKAEQTKMESDITVLKKDLNSLRTSQNKLKLDYEEKLRSLTEAQLKAERYSRSFNLRFGGIPEKENEEAIQEVKRVLSDYLQMEPVIENAHRIGKRSTGKPRQIIAKLLYRPQRKEILLKCRRALQDSPYFITEDLTSEDFKKKASLRHVMSAAFQEGKRPRFVNGKLFINGELYVHEDSPLAPTA